MWKRFFSRKILLQKIFVPEETFTEKDFTNYKIQTWIQEYFSTEKFPGHTSLAFARSGLALGSHPKLTREYPQVFFWRKIFWPHHV
jgi:hypothetical protein